MKKSVLSFVLISLLSQGVFASRDVERVKQAIAAKGANWTAGESWVTQLPLEELKRLGGAEIPVLDRSKAKLITLPKVESLPPVFDWRNNNGNWMTPVKSQAHPKPCGSCWDFAALAAVEAWWKIHHGNPAAQIDLSEQFILSCSEGNCVNWSVEQVFEFVQTVGVPTEACLPYQGDDTIPCSSACGHWEQEAVTIPDWGYVTLGEAKIENIKSALLRRPVVAYLLIYDDLRYYTGGVYEHVWGNLVSGHAVVLVGWNDHEQSWICKNSWSSSWGDGGYFRIKWGECEIGTFCPYIWDGQTGGPALTTIPNKLDLTIVAGDSLFESLTIQNLGVASLEYSTLDISCTASFHSDSYMSFDSLSWWCGDPPTGTYHKNWLQCLDTPVLDLSATDQPRLSWRGFWQMQDTSGIHLMPPFDGWEGCNVWVSTDRGNTFVIAEPIRPRYTSRRLYSFSLWRGISESTAGWTGISGRWQEVEFDLSSYRSDDVVIRFAFASLPTNFVRGMDPTRPGFFVDDIVITDGSIVLFEDHGNDASRMIAYGETHSMVDWLEVVNGSGSLSGGESTVTQMRIGARNLEPGKYRGGLTIFSNDTTAFRQTVPVDLLVTHPDHDILVRQIWPVTEELPILARLRPTAKVKNQGLNAETNFSLSCMGSFAGQVIYRDTYLVTSLASDADKNVLFEPVAFAQTGKADFTISLVGVAQDRNAYNDSITFETHVSNLMDDFEFDSDFWDLEEGWVIKSTNSHSGVRSATTLIKTPLNCCLTFKPGFNLSLVDEASLTFWTRYIIDKGSGVCHVEASRDSMAWVQLDSLSGRQWPQWVQRQISLNQFVGTGNEHVWVRFHFISDSVNTYVGAFIDDMEIYPEAPTIITDSKFAASLPAAWNLSQNYPNPFNPTTTITFALPRASFVTLKVYDLLGNEIASLVSEKLPAGRHQRVWEAKDLASGVYLYRLQAGEFEQVKKLILLR
ncbi:MAG: hypothetical protein DKINENOH_01664 [bacterium]|nr:hypothetical protein [bacterium]